MRPTRLGGDGYWILGALLPLIAAVSASVIVSCGSGGSSNGGLCEQCGVSPDGPCQESVIVAPGPNAPVPPCSAVPNPEATCQVFLICRRKVDSAQQRCFARVGGKGSDVNYQFRCDGSRPGGTIIPTTPTPTASSTPIPTKTPDASAVCGNGIIEGVEDCDTGALDGNSCDDFCNTNAGTLLCTTSCTFDTSQCTGGNCSVP